jgi:hypothetical protein
MDKTALTRLRVLTYDELSHLYTLGTMPAWEDLQGFCRGRFLAYAPGVSWVVKLKRWALFDLRGWQGKVFRKPWPLGTGGYGTGINRFLLGIEGYEFCTLDMMDAHGRRSLWLDYRPYPSLMGRMGLVDRCVWLAEPGVLMGKMFLGGAYAEVGFFALEPTRAR